MVLLAKAIIIVKNNTITRGEVKLRTSCLLIAGIFFVAACASSTTPSPTMTEMPVETEAVSRVRPAANECLVCHVDKQSLIETAKPEEIVEKESSGAG